MKTFSILFSVILFVTQVHAQKIRSPFRKGYTRIGISTLGNNLDDNLSPKDNIFGGNFGASTGIVSEVGHVFYFKSTKKISKINVGLDWTILSMSYNKLNGWDKYGAASATDNVTVDGAKLSLAVASKLGPVISFNPFEKLVVDVRFQVAPVARISNIEYAENNDAQNVRSFTFYNYGEEAINHDFEAESFKNLLSFGIGTNVGISVRRKAIGLALDYNSVKAKTNFDAYEGEENHTFGKEKMPYHSFQLKLSFTL